MSEHAHRSLGADPAVIATALAIGHDAPVIADASFAIPTASVTAVIGPNGSGKSTLLNAIAGLLEPMHGSLEVLGRRPKQAQTDVSYVLQGTAITPGVPITVRQTVRMARYATTGPLGRWRQRDRDLVASAMRQLDIDSLDRRHLSELSGGQRQRVFVAQAVAQDHAMLLMDEPLTGLDLNSARTIDELIHAESERGCTVIITTHDLDEARAAQHVLLLGAGQVISGPPAQVLTTANLTRAYGLGTRHPTHPIDTHPPTAHHEEVDRADRQVPSQRTSSAYDPF
ncbi:MAG: metal ABC transporter ATP-binding protein [Actinomycetales bacterium]